MTGFHRGDSPAGAERLAERFEAARPRLRRIALRILGSPAESDDAVQESWLRIGRADVARITNLEAWLTTVVARVCLDALKRRESRREELTPDDPRRDVAAIAPGERPEEEAMLADSIGAALLVCSMRSRPQNASHSCCTTCSTCRSMTSPASSEKPRRRRGNLQAGRAAACVAHPYHDPATRRNDELVRAFLQASRAGNSPPCSHYSIPSDPSRRCSGGGDGRRGVLAERSPADRHRRRRGRRADVLGRARAAQAALIDGEPGAVWKDEGEVRVAFRFRSRTNASSRSTRRPSSSARPIGHYAPP